jgi:hypothetical protein
MGRGAVRTGTPVAPTRVNAGTDGNLDNPIIYLFDPPVRPCIVTCHNQNDEVLIKVNVETDGTVTSPFSGGTGKKAGHFVLPPRVTFADAAKDPPEGGPRWVDVSLGGQVLVFSVSMANVNSSDDLDAISVVGWTD